MDQDLKWYEKYTGFEYVFGDDGYAGLQRDNLEFHLQFHHGNENDPILCGSVMKIFVDDIKPYFKEFVERGTVAKDKLTMNTPWRTHEISFFDMNKNTIFIVPVLKKLYSHWNDFYGINIKFTI